MFNKTQISIKTLQKKINLKIKKKNKNEAACRKIPVNYHNDQGKDTIELRHIVLVSHHRERACTIGGSTEVSMISVCI